MKQILFIFYLYCLFVNIERIQASESTSSFEKAYILPDNANSISLNGEWQFQYPVGNRWNNVQVPGEVAMQGYAIEHDKPFLYKKNFTIPRNYAGKLIILRFDGVYSTAKLFINGKEARKHQGGFTRWETDITSFVKPGEKNEIKVEVIDSKDDISFGSGYAHHPIGGILRDVTLFALPRTHLYDVNIETKLDTALKDATLCISGFSESDQTAEAVLKLTSPDGKEMSLSQNKFALSSGQMKYNWQIPVKNPLKWDAEHPYLYSLNISIRKGEKELCSFSRKVGFRQIEIKDRQMFVNGYPVKLRGACRHDMHPTLGRTTTAELDSLDAILFKEANMNFVRTSHYPPTERFLDYCDRYGIYVECETAVCFQNKSEDLPQYANQYVSQVKEMVKSFRTHPSIIIWSIGNESKYGENFYKSWEWVKATDTTRPVIFSWPGHQRDDKTKVYDIVSIHYPSTGGSLKQKGIPVKNFEAEENKPTLFDEWAHPACYTYETLQNDPNIREFWGQSIDMMWSNLFNVHGGLGGAIWCYVDETFMLPEPKTGTAFWRDIKYDDKPKENIGKCVGYGEWGIVDVWRRKKPEFWATKKAYSPIRLSIEKNISDFASGKNILIQVHNRFNHTDLKDIQGIYTYRGKKYKLQLPSIPPHKQGKIMLPSQPWATGEKIKIEFYTKDGNLIDIYQPVLGEEKIKLPEPAFTNKGITVEEDTEFLTIYGKEFKIPFSKKSGLIVNAMVKGKTVIEKGPFLHHRNYQKNKKSGPKTIPFNISENDWIKTSLLHKKHDDKVIVELSGKYKDVTVDYQITVMSDGRIFISYHATGIPNELLYESGIALHLPNDLSRLTWKRNGHWGYYDDSSFAGNEGSTSLYNSNLIAYGQQPKQPWSMDTHNYFYWADTGSNCKKPLTRAAKGMKENIYYYTLFAKSKENSSLSVFSSDASIGCRLSKRSDEQLVLYINNRWDYPDIAWGNYCKRIKALPCKGEITLQLR